MKTNPETSPAAAPYANAEANRQVADVEIAAGKLGARVRLEVTPVGLLSIGALVSSILLSTAVLVWTATSVPRRHPLATRLRPR